MQLPGIDFQLGEDIDALRSVQFVMKNGAVFKKDGVITLDKLLNPGPVNGWRRR